MAVTNLWVVMPVYNEEEALPGVINEWYPALEKTGLNFTLLVLNDGSKDGTLAYLRSAESKFPKMRVVDKPNSGHAQTCLDGYRLALKEGADWIFQIDSDGQCDPKFFPRLLQYTGTHKAIYGRRTKRDDGFQRMVVSRFVSLFTYVATGTWVRDANVPYRLIHRDIMTRIVDRVPKDFHLANIYVSVLSQQFGGIKWVPIHFRDRAGGSPSVKTVSFVKHGFKLFRQLKQAVDYGKRVG